MDFIDEVRTRSARFVKPVDHLGVSLTRKWFASNMDVRPVRVDEADGQPNKQTHLIQSG